MAHNPVDHLSFGYGPRGCAGHGLAKLEAHAVIEALARRVQSLTIGDAVREPSNITRSIEKLEVVKVVAARGSNWTGRAARGTDSARKPRQS